MADVLWSALSAWLAQMAGYKGGMRWGSPRKTQVFFGGWDYQKLQIFVVIFSPLSQVPPQRANDLESQESVFFLMVAWDVHRVKNWLQMLCKVHAVFLIVYMIKVSRWGSIIPSISTLKHFGLRNWGLHIQSQCWKLPTGNFRQTESSEFFIMMKRRIFRHLTKNEKLELSFFSLIHVKTWLNG